MNKGKSGGQHENCITDGYTYHYSRMWMKEMTQQLTLGSPANEPLADFKFSDEFTKLFKAQEFQNGLYLRRCVKKSASSPSESATVVKLKPTSEGRRSGTVSNFLSNYEKFLSDPRASVIRNVGGLVENADGNVFVLNKKNVRISEEDHQYMKTAEMYDQTRRYDALVRAEIRAVLQNYRGTLTYYENQGEKEVERVLQPPWSDMYETLKKEHQNDGTSVQEGI